MIWNYDDLWNKAKLYLQRGFAETPESPLFPFWLALGLELLGRATLSKVHPCLLADPSEGDNILYACGFLGKNPPKSVQAKTVFHRCKVIIPEFTEDNFKFATAIMERRNAELHSGELSFEDYPNKIWLPEFFHVCEILVKHQEKSLDDLLGSDVAKTAQSSILALTSKRKDVAMNLIAEAKRQFDALEPKERLERLTKAEETIKKKYIPRSKQVKCPACGAQASVSGEAARYLEPRVTADAIVEKAIIIPTKLECFSCELLLSSHENVVGAGFGDQFTVEEETDPKDYYGIEFEPSDYYEPDYGND